MEEEKKQTLGFVIGYLVHIFKKTHHAALEST